MTDAPVGRAVTVYYDSADPRDALLERANAPTAAAAVFAAGFVVMAGAVAWAWVVLQAA